MEKKFSTKTFQGSMFKVTVAINEDLLRSMQNAPELATRALQAGADYWHTGILPKHFEKSAHDRYGYARRARTYLKQKHGKPDLINSGSLRRDLMARASFTVKSKATVELRMSARVLNFCPRMAENSLDHYVKHSNSRGYPNLKRELKVVLPEERQAISAVIAERLEIFFGNNEGRESDD